MTPNFDTLANQYLEEELSDSQKKKLLALGLGSAMALPVTGYLGQKAGEALRDDPAPKVQKVQDMPGAHPFDHPGWSDDDISPPPGVPGIPQPARSPEVKPVKQPTPAPQYDPGFLQYMKSVENSIKKGFKKGKWYPHSSVEGGRKTIAYGHKLKPGEDFSKGLTDREAVTLLIKDLDHHKAQAQKYVDKKYGAGSFNKLDPKRQEMLIDIQFNIRHGVSKFPSFLKAVMKNDKKGMLKHYQRKYRNPKTKKWHPIKDRNQQFKKRYLK